MRALTVNTQAATESLDSTTPAFLVEMDFSTTLRLSSRGDQAWNGYTWTGGRLFSVSGLKWDGKGQQSGALAIINSDLAYSALILNEGVADRRIRIWKFYGDNPAASDPVEVFYGVGDESDLSDPDMVRISLVGDNTGTINAPVRFIGPGTGFNHITPAGTRITWGGQTYTLEPGN
jgi:hypothetical protein